MVAHHGVSAADYWDMTIKELELIHDAKRSRMVGNMHEDEYIRQENRREQLELEGVNVL